MFGISERSPRSACRGVLGFTKTLAPVGPQGTSWRAAPPDAWRVADGRRAGPFLWTTGHELRLPSRSRSLKKQTACHSRAQRANLSRDQTRKPGRRTRFWKVGIRFGSTLKPGGSAMKISGIRSQIVALPCRPTEPLADAAENPDGTRPIVTLSKVENDGGIAGLVGVGTIRWRADRHLEKCRRRTRRADGRRGSVRVEAVVAKLRAAAGSAGPAGIST